MNLIISMGELAPFLLLTLVGLFQFRQDQSKSFKLWFMGNFILAFLALFIASKTNLLYNSFNFNALFRIRFLEIPLIFVFSWLNLVLAVITSTRNIKFKSEKNRNIYSTTLLFLISILAVVALDKMRLILVIGLFESILPVLIWLCLSVFGIYSFDFLKMKTPKFLIMYSSIFQLITLFLLSFFKSI